MMSEDAVFLRSGHRYFKVRDRDGALYILRHDITSQHWELRFFSRAPAP